MRMHWDDLPTATRDAVAARTGPIYATASSDKGLNSELAATLDTRAGRVFVKGLRCDHPRAWTQEREATINPYVAPLAPRLLWRINDGEWHLLGFEHLDGRPAEYAPGSDDLPLVAEAIITLSGVHAPSDVELKQIEQRFADYVDHPDDAALLRGDTVLHTDWTPDNVLIVGNVARIVDWAWPTRGAAWIDAACWVVWLVAAGHAPEDAELWAAKTPAWSTAPARALDVFAAAQQRLWAGIASDSPEVAWKRKIADAAQQWLTYRQA
ncbi:aminoglycoside phosphotransferase (plasmid) [Streptomyces nigrescens]|uniref:Aminoglycoside phosphotransferase n=2 Tax=Streptomyces nigrescens TaxID=1920 RepID=A0ABY7JG58_STRNI|nr:aminoglycoside phosphotransferase [Streptomyces nigrescens]WAU09704.1 aminoglycoside phosphotransferase [Streptomyces nigrescens]WAU09970.1 aminoglycoside phosphotransferase [Streptomyces nigrescens]